MGSLIHDVSRLRRTIVDKALGPVGVTRSQWWVLLHLSLCEGGTMMQTNLAHTLEIGKVTLGSLVDKLERHGYVRRIPDAHDRRAKHIEMTDAGGRLLDSIKQRAAELNVEMMAGITDQEMADFEQILDKMKKRLQKMDGYR